MGTGRTLAQGENSGGEMERNREATLSPSWYCLHCSLLLLLTVGVVFFEKLGRQLIFFFTLTGHDTSFSSSQQKWPGGQMNVWGWVSNTSATHLATSLLFSRVLLLTLLPLLVCACVCVYVQSEEYRSMFYRIGIFTFFTIFFRSYILSFLAGNGL